MLKRFFEWFVSLESPSYRRLAENFIVVSGYKKIQK